MLEIMSFNIKGMLNKRGQFYVFKKLIEFKHVDFLCLQEVFVKNGEVVGHEKLKEKYPYYSLGINANLDRGQLANAIFSKYPILSEVNNDLSIKNKEPRGAQSVSIKIKDNIVIKLVNIHLGLGFKERKTQFSYIKKNLLKDSPKQSLLLCGDFNDWSGAIPNQIKSDLHTYKEATLATNSKLHKTFPTIFPMFPLDRIYHNEKIKVESYQILKGKYWRQVSDHYPILLKFKCE